MVSNKLPTKNVVSFLELRKRCPKDQLNRLDKFQAKHKEYQERVLSLKKDLPIIDWDYYKRNVRAESVAMVEDFEKKYLNLIIPYPEDKYSKEIDKNIEDVKIQIKEFKDKSNERIAAYEKEIARIQSMIPLNQMTMEDFCILYPESAPDFINKPTFWPHTEEEQIGYVEKEKDGKDDHK